MYDFFCDLDGVLVNFERGYCELTGIKIGNNFLTGHDFWHPIDKAGYNFWINLQWKEDGKKLWNYIEKYNPTILSAPSKQNDSKIGKHDWVKRELPGVHLILRSAEHKKELSLIHI